MPTTAAAAAARPVDLLTAGLLFFDVLYRDLPQAPPLGQETWTANIGVMPGGIANFAVAGARLGLTVDLAAAVGTDPISSLVLAELGAAGVGTQRCHVHSEWRLPITAGLNYDGDRALITGGTQPPSSIHEALDLTGARAVAVHLPDEPPAWLSRIPAGCKVFADVGWDGSDQWDTAMLEPLRACYAFLPNADEAMAYTRTDSPLAAARALAEYCPIVVVTCAGDGAIGIDSGSGTEVVVPAIPVTPSDSTGAGDTFAAAFIAADLAGLPLADRLNFAALCAALKVADGGPPPTLAQMTEYATRHQLGHDYLHALSPHTWETS